MSFGVIFLILAVGFLGLITVPKLLKRPPVVEPDPKPVRGDELAIWPFAPMPIMTDTEVIFFNKLKSALPDIIFSFKFNCHALSKAIAVRRPSVAFGSIVSVVKASIM
ncbi:hypothetical protein [Psychrobacter sp. WY6]|uniref:hypothetical protein n=1 Tax=Psychrobacter sp. WY6 TaxID=2708350 RepID=UPI002022D55D|nr:hypothetical protein [Psychrobacter sp. WY6]